MHSFQNTPLLWLSFLIAREKSLKFCGKITWFLWKKHYLFFSFLSLMYREMSNSSLENVIKVLQKNQNKAIPSSTLEQWLQSAFSEPLTKGKIYKLTYQLKNKGYLLSLRKDVLYITSPDKMVDIPAVEEQCYRSMLHAHCKKYCDTKWYIWDLSALELNLHGAILTIPDEIIVFNNKKQSIETVLFDKKINFKTYESKTKNLYASFAKHTKKIKIKGWTFFHANFELAILECLYCPTLATKQYSETLILQAIKAHQKTLSFKNFDAILATGKHGSSANRLLKLIQGPYPALAEQLKALIKKHGNLL